MTHLWKKWKGVAERIGDFQARLLLSLFYFFILPPFALVLRMSSDPLGIKPDSRRGWNLKTQPEGTPMDRAGRQF